MRAPPACSWSFPPPRAHVASVPPLRLPLLLRHSSPWAEIEPRENLLRRGATHERGELDSRAGHAHHHAWRPGPRRASCAETLAERGRARGLAAACGARPPACDELSFASTP